MKDSIKFKDLKGNELTLEFIFDSFVITSDKYLQTLHEPFLKIKNQNESILTDKLSEKYEYSIEFNTHMKLLEFFEYWLNHKKKYEKIKEGTFFGKLYNKIILGV